MLIKFTSFIFFLTVCAQTDGKIINSLCNKPINNPKKLENEEKSVCECVTENSPTWGELVLVIDCSEKSLDSDGFNAEILPNFTVSLDIPYNNFKILPIFEGNELSFLDASYNKIKALKSDNFVKIPSLMHLDLSNNVINTIDKNSFNGLTKLTKINLAHNMLHLLPNGLFLPLNSLDYLILSGNVGLNETFSQVGVDLFLKLGVTPNLQKLEIERCNLSTIDLERGSWLVELYLTGNNMTEFSNIPSGIRILDISRNPIKTLHKLMFSQLTSLEMILLQDMSDLVSVEAQSLYPLKNLKHISFRGSDKLEHLHPDAFGYLVDVNDLPSIEIFNLQGTSISSLNESMYEILKNTQAIDLYGAPLNCDCNLRWIKKLNIETNGQCRTPKHLRGVLLSGVPEKNFECRLFPKWVYTTFNAVIILVVLILCSLGVWFVIMKLKRTTENRHKTKVHTSSPYSPITVSTNVRNSNSPYY